MVFLDTDLKINLKLWKIIFPKTTPIPPKKSPKIHHQTYPPGTQKQHPNSHNKSPSLYKKIYIIVSINPSTIPKTYPHPFPTSKNLLLALNSTLKFPNRPTLSLFQSRKRYQNDIKIISLPYQKDPIPPAKSWPKPPLQHHPTIIPVPEPSQNPSLAKTYCPRKI